MVRALSISLGAPALLLLPCRSAATPTSFWWHGSKTADKCRNPLAWEVVVIHNAELEELSLYSELLLLDDPLVCTIDQAVETFAEQLDAGHKDSCSWRGNCCADSLVQFPPMLPSAIIGGYKNRCDGLLQFPFLPVVASSAIETMRLTRSSKIDHMLAQPSGFFFWGVRL
ncbi:hypothetical protein ZIOFF_076234 [Zingiber officinale]|uniref:C3HC-type domain-containing protein n=1 Tax=Zingiber officinale TaxID=94328 RepID=A0A8J5BSQ4_ZINOF|nr:hypothetical protein ZIOFF_076234 [Zingiber officinale]